MVSTGPRMPVASHRLGTWRWTPLWIELDAQPYDLTSNALSTRTRHMTHRNIWPEGRYKMLIRMPHRHLNPKPSLEVYNLVRANCKYAAWIDTATKICNHVTQYGRQLSCRFITSGTAIHFEAKQFKIRIGQRDRLLFVAIRFLSTKYHSSNVPCLSIFRAWNDMRIWGQGIQSHSLHSYS
jgi:hypothetical protein